MGGTVPLITPASGSLWRELWLVGSDCGCERHTPVCYLQTLLSVFDRAESCEGIGPKTSLTDNELWRLCYDRRCGFIAKNRAFLKTKVAGRLMCQVLIKDETLLSETHWKLDTNYLGDELGLVETANYWANTELSSPDDRYKRAAAATTMQRALGQ